MKRIRLTQGRFALVDDEDHKKFSSVKWFAHFIKSKWYATTNTKLGENGTQRTLHRAVMDAKIGETVDHINGDGLDCRRENLRKCTQRQNTKNRVKSRRNTSGFKGVSFDSERRKWQSKICVNYKTIHLGRFEEKIHAAMAYNIAAERYHKDFALLNTIPQ